MHPGLDPRKTKLAPFIKTIAIESGFGQKYAYEVFTAFLNELPKYLKLHRSIFLPGVGEFYLQKSIILIKDQPQQYDRIRFRATRSFKWYINNRKGEPNGRFKQPKPAREETSGSGSS